MNTPTPIPASDDELTTRALLASAETLLGQDGVAVFREVDGELTAVPYASSDTARVFYELTTFAEGSWWLPTGTEASLQWQGSQPLKASGDIQSTAVLRPADLYWWIPAGTFGPWLQPLTVFGRVDGDGPARPGSDLLPG